MGGGRSYGSPSAPLELGSGGGGVNTIAGGAGGGAIKIIATNAIVLNHGVIQANGGTGDAADFGNMVECSGGGSGGSTWLDTPTLTVSAGSSINAVGGTNINPFCSSSWAGGGGRIRLPFPPYNLSINSGYGSVYPPTIGGAAGTQYDGDGLKHIAFGATTSNSAVQLVASKVGVDSNGSFEEMKSINGYYFNDESQQTQTNFGFGNNGFFLTLHVTYQGTESISGITYNDQASLSQNLTKGCSSEVNGLHSEIWYLLNPNVNSNTFTTSFTGAGVTHVGEMANEFFDVSTSQPVASAFCNQGSFPTNPMVSVSPTSNQLAVGGATILIANMGGFIPRLMPDAGSYQLQSQFGQNFVQTLSSKTEGNLMSWDGTNGSDWATSALILNKADTVTPYAYHFQAEVQPVGTSFTNAANVIMPLLYNGRTTNAIMPFNAPSAGSYHWQFQTCDVSDQYCSGWAAVTGNPQSFADFVVTSTVVSPNAPSSLGASNVTDGSTSSNTQPVLAFSLSDPDGAAQVGYELQVATDALFSSPVVDYVSALGAQGSGSFTVGEASGSGYYVQGNTGQQLTDGAYYWRVKAINQSSAVSSFVAANSGAVAFQVGSGGDVTPPTLSFTASASGNVMANQVQYVGTAVDETAMATVEYSVDGGTRTNANPTTTNPLAYPFSIDLTSLNLSLGAHTVEIFADDATANEVNHTFTINVVTDNIPPVLNFTASASGDVVATHIIYTGTATDETAMAQIQYGVDGGTPTPYSTDTSNPLSYPFTLDFSGFNLSGGAHTIQVIALDAAGNQTLKNFNINVVVDTTPPTLSFTATPSAYTHNPVTFTGTAIDETAMGSVKYSIDGGAKTDGAPTTTDPRSYPFLVAVSLADGSHTATIYADDSAGNETTQSFSFIVSSVAPTCTAGWMNQPIPVYTIAFDYTNIHCTGPLPITSAIYWVYLNSRGTAITDTPVTSVSGVASTDETYNFTVNLSAARTAYGGNIDGTMEVIFIVTDIAGNTSYDSDPVTLAANDNTPPTINLDAITPNPLTDTQPKITGSCRDDTSLAKNTYISNMNYSLDGGANTDIVPLDGTYNDAFAKNFSVQLPTLALGAHTVTMHCTDGSSNTSNTSQSFTIVAPVSAAPGTFNYTENFNSNMNQDIPNSNNMVWGNGKLRLKEDITTSRTLINSTGHCSLYTNCRNTGGIWQDLVDSHILYYALGGVLYTYNTQTQVNSVWNYQAEYGIRNYGAPSVFSLGMYQGKEYLWIADFSGLSIVNMTDRTHVDKAITNLNGIATDFGRGRLAAYLQGDAPSGYSNLAYLDLNGTITDTSDDIYTRVPLSTLNSVSFLFSTINPTKNAVYWASYNDGMYVWNDNNNPSDVAHYTLTHYTTSQFRNVWSFNFDLQGNLIYGTASNGGQGIFVLNDNGHPFDSSLSTITHIATNRQMGYQDIDAMQYVKGENGVGDQLFVSNGNTDPTYFNFNSNYTTMTDKTFISLPIINALRPDSVQLFMTDYNTGYALVMNQGFFKIDLHRGWASSGDAVALPTRPPQALVVNNFVAQANIAAPIASLMKANVPQNFLASLSKAFVPQAQAAGGDGITYYVSTDGGITWTQVTLGQLQQMQQSDYHVKFKISMVPVNGASPVLDSYTLAYAGYQSQAQQTTTVGLGVTTPSTTTVAPATNFSLTIQGVDTLGFLTPTYTGTVNLSLIDANSNAVVSGLNVSGAAIGAGGTTTLSNVQIAQAGSYKIRATDGTYTNDSAVITVTVPPAPPTNTPNLNQPTVAFWADTYTIKNGETVNLNWSSSNVTSWKIQPGDKVLDKAAGSYTVAPTQTTTYTITADGPNGSVTNTLVITVSGTVATSGTTTTSPASPSATSQQSLTASSSSSAGGVTSPVLTFSPDQTIVKGEKATISWNVLGAETVTIDFPTPHTVSSSGSFEFYPTSTTTVGITSTINGQVTTKKITVTVIDAPVVVQQTAKWFQTLFPALTPLVSGAIQSTKSVPKIGLWLAAAMELGVVGLLTASIGAEVGLSAAFNGKTLLNILSAAGILPSKQRKGFVHQTKTGSPIPFALISVYESAKTHVRPIVTLVTDMFGVYNDPFLEKGEYDFVVAQDEFSFPTKLQRPIHLSYKDFYRGEVLNVASKKDRSALLIPMDAKVAQSKSKVWRARLLLSLNRTLNALQVLVLPFALMAMFALWLSPGLWNVVIVGIYLIVLIPKLIKHFRSPALQGRVTTVARKPVLNATVTLSTLAGGVVALSKTDAQGHFAFFAPKGQYAVNVVSDNLLWNEQQVGTLYTVNANGAGTSPLSLTMSKIENPFGPNPL